MPTFQFWLRGKKRHQFSGADEWAKAESRFFTRRDWTGLKLKLSYTWQFGDVALGDWPSVHYMAIVAQHVIFSNLAKTGLQHIGHQRHLEGLLYTLILKSIYICFYATNKSNIVQCSHSLNGNPIATLWLCQNSYWKWPSRNSGFTMIYPLKLVIFHSFLYVYQRVTCHMRRMRGAMRYSLREWTRKLVDEVCLAESDDDLTGQIWSFKRLLRKNLWKTHGKTMGKPMEKPWENPWKTHGKALFLGKTPWLFPMGFPWDFGKSNGSWFRFRSSSWGRSGRCHCDTRGVGGAWVFGAVERSTLW